MSFFSISASYGYSDPGLKSKQIKYSLEFDILGKIFSNRILKHFFFLSQDIRFNSSCRLFPYETVGMKCQTLFSGECKKNIVNLLYAEFSQRSIQ